MCLIWKENRALDFISGMCDNAASEKEGIKLIIYTIKIRDNKLEEGIQLIQWNELEKMSFYFDSKL